MSRNPHGKTAPTVMGSIGVIAAGVQVSREEST